MARLLGSARKFGLHPRLQAAYQLGVTLFVLFAALNSNQLPLPRLRPRCSVQKFLDLLKNAFAPCCLMTTLTKLHCRTWKS